MFILINSLVVSLLLLSMVFYSFFTFTGRFTAMKTLLLDGLASVIESNISKSLLLFLFVSFFMINVMGNIPLNNIPTMFYSLTFTVSLLFWIPLMICVSITQLKGFIAHMVPYGCPTAIMFFLPLVEMTSQLIRPLTLMIRLSTNLSAGHIMMYIFSYFTLLSAVVSPFIYIVLYILFFLELAISMLQAYIFVSLLSLYINETV